MKICEGAYYRTRGGQVFGPMVPGGNPASDYVWCLDPLKGFSWDSEGLWRKGWDGPMDLISEVYVSVTPPSDDVMLNLSEIARTKTKAMGEGNFGIDENPPCGIRLRWLVEVVDRPHDTPPADAPTPEAIRNAREYAGDAARRAKEKDTQIEAQAAEITRLRAELATARKDALEEAAQDLEGRAKVLRIYNPDSVGAHWAMHYAAAIRALKGEGDDH
jgi:hypothetical protein